MTLFRCLLLAAGSLALAAGVGLLAGPTRTARVLVLPAPPTAQQTRAAVREAADAVAGAVSSGDAAGLCQVLSRNERELAAQDRGDCVSAARDEIANYGRADLAVGVVVVTSARDALVHVHVQGAPTLWRFRLERGRWRFDGGAAENVA